MALPIELQGEGKELEKSILLAKAMGCEPHFSWSSKPSYWNVRCRPLDIDIDFSTDEVNNLASEIGNNQESALLLGIPDLYASENMALAWRVLNWACDDEKYRPNIFEECRTRINWSWDIEMRDLVTLKNLLEKPPAEAQATWLDKVLELAIEAGLVEVDKEIVL